MKGATVRYHAVIHDSARFEGFEFRDGDIIISTPPKCGTTWTQTICALLIFQTTKFPHHLDLISPWLEQSLRPLDSVVADLDAQTHRRFIKSHTPFDGLPDDDRVTYICVGRDPRDVALSWDNHFSNANFQTIFELRDKAVGNDDLAEMMANMQPPAPTEVERFWQWVDDPTPVTETVSGLRYTLHHLDTFFRERSRPNVLMLHYGELKADLEGQMRAIAQRLGIDVPEALWSELVGAATFESMKSSPETFGPNQTENIWLERDRFFHKGTSGQWRPLLDAEGLKRYASRVEELASRELADWAHQGLVTS